MKLFRPLLLVLLCLVLTVLCACPAPDVVGPGSSTTTNNSGSGDSGSSGSGSGNTPVDPTIPVGATYRPSDTGERAAYWKKLSAPAGSFAASAYTNAASGLTNESATPTAGTDLAYGFAVPHDGNYEVGADMLALAAADGEVTLAVYKNGAKIWPVSEDTYTATTENGSARFTATTSAKKGDVIYIRTSGNTALNISPRVTLVSGGYSENRDIEKNFPTVGVLSDVGSTLTNGDFVMTPVTEPIDGTTFGGVKIGNRILRNQMLTGDVFFAEDDEDIIIDATGREGVFDGKGAIIVTGGRVEIMGLADGCEITNLVIFAYGGVYVTETTGGILSNVSIVGNVDIAKDVSGLRLNSCRIEASGTALENKGENITLFSSCVEGSNVALVDTGKGGGLYVDCVLSGYHTAVILGGSDSTVRRSTVYGDIVTEGALENLLVAECVMKNLGAILYDSTHNSVILFNEVENVTVKNATNAYVAENAIYGGLLFDNVRYMIAEDNVLATAVPALVSVRDYNGDNVTDITARADVGVNEDLLPHVNLDTFINMERKTVVRDTTEKEERIQNYLKNLFDAGEKRIIVAPGAYTADAALSVSSIKDVEIFGYGVLFERTAPSDGAFFFYSSERVSFYGMTVGISKNTTDQLIVLKKLGDNKVLCVNAAGTEIRWNGTTSSVQEAYRWDEAYPYGGDLVAYDNPPKDSNNFWTLSYGSMQYEQIEVGDVLNCRNGSSVMRMSGTKSIYFEDITIVGGAIRCFWDDSVVEGSILHRVADLPRPAAEISKETYDYYKQLEQTYGLPENYLVYIDEFGNYRGMASKTATADGTHGSDCRTGFTVTSCIFSGLSDDGTNHQGFYDRVAGYDEATGTLTIVDDTVGGTSTVPYSAGDRIVVFTLTGQVLADTVTLTSSTKSGSSLSVKIDKTLLSEEELNSYIRDPESATAQRVLVYNASRCGDGMRYDNNLMQNMRARGYLVKCTDAVITNCTFRNIGMGAIAVYFELGYGESGLGQDVTIKNCYFENTGYSNSQLPMSPISIYGPAMKGEEDYTFMRNIHVEGNVVRNRGSVHALYANGVDGMVVKNNDFGDRLDPNLAGEAVCLNFCRNVEFSGNTYTEYYENTAAAQILLSGVENVFGSDIAGEVDDTLINGTDRVTSYAENIPTRNPNGGLNYWGGWSVGYMPSASMSYTAFNKINSGDVWLSHSSAYNTAAATAGMEYRFKLYNSSFAVAISYTVEEDATLALSLAYMFAPERETSAIGVYGDALFAVFVGDEMVFPTPGGSYTNEGDWLYVDSEYTQGQLNRELDKLRIDVAAGEKIYFVAKLPTGGAASLFGVVPNVYYLK